MKKDILIILTIFTLITGVCTVQSFAQTSKIIEKTIQKVSKSAAKDGAKKVLKKEVAKSSRIVNSGLRTTAKGIIKSKGYKSYISFSKNEGQKILSQGKIGFDRKTLNNDFRSQYSKSISKAIKAVASPKRIATTATLQYFPTGAKAILTKWDRNKRGYIPAFDAKKLSTEDAKKLFVQRRKAISPFNQFATKEQLKKYDNNLIVTGKEKDATVLKNNMFKVMDPNVEKQINAFGGVAAHHVIPGNDQHAKAAREILKRFKIDINGPENGIFLPTDNKSIYKGVIHNTSHSPKYSKIVYSELKNCNSRDEVINALDKIKHNLYNGGISLKDGINEVNKNL